METIAPGLFRWTAPHPDWRGDGVEDDHPLDWPRDVGCVAAHVGDAVVFIDPLVPDELWPQLDALAEGRDAVVLVTLPFHGRSADAVAERYGASSELPPGVVALAVPRAGERVFWLPAHAALVPGDALINRPKDGGLRIPPQPWLDILGGGSSREQVAEDLRPLLDLPVERILVSHGAPVLSGAREALERALA
jgi:hypothetical protein